jgi:hypothetical protein
MAGVLIREAPISREEVLDGLRAAAGSRTVDAGADAVSIDGGRIVVNLTTKERPGEGPPLLVADFAFENVTDDDVRMFMEHYDRVMQDAV